MDQHPIPERAFPHERLEVYQLAEQTLPLVAAITRRVPHRDEHLRSQAVRSASSMVLNTAEGASELSRGEKARFYRMARRSAGELASTLRVLEQLGIVSAAEIAECRALLQRISLMLFRLIEAQARRK